MTYSYKVDSPDKFSKEERDAFLHLLKKQGQVQNVTKQKFDSCSLICTVHVDNDPVGIGALKNVYKDPFTYAGVENLKDKFNGELGYLYVDNDPIQNLRGLGIGKNISKLLVAASKGENIFATTELNNSNRMLGILKDLGFIQVGSPFKGTKTNKILSLLILNQESA